MLNYYAQFVSSYSKKNAFRAIYEDQSVNVV